MSAPGGLTRGGGPESPHGPPSEPAAPARPGVHIAATALAQLHARATAAYPLECCGALAGPGAGRAAPSLVLRAIPLENEAPQRRGCRFLITAAAVRVAELTAALEGLEVVGFYHSHPDHPARPSALDLAHAWPWYAYVVVGVVHPGKVGAVRAWRLRDDRAAFDEAELVTVREAP